MFWDTLPRLASTKARMGRRFGIAAIYLRRVATAWLTDRPVRRLKREPIITSQERWLQPKTQWVIRRPFHTTILFCITQNQRPDRLVSLPLLQAQPRMLFRRRLLSLTLPINFPPGSASTMISGGSRVRWIPKPTLPMGKAHRQCG